MLLPIFQDLARPLQEDAARGGQRHASLRPREQRHAQPFFQLLDLPRQRRLGDRQPARGAPEMELLRDDGE